MNHLRRCEIYKLLYEFDCLPALSAVEVEYEFLLAAIQGTQPNLPSFQDVQEVLNDNESILIK